MDERLFSYGTLQLETVQIAQFGRRLDGVADALVGWRRDMVEITDPDVLATSGERYHPIVRETGDPDDGVPGLVFTVSAWELERADAYEVDDYVRVRVKLRSGMDAWVYVAA
jgi:hypothetical protein